MRESIHLLDTICLVLILGGAGLTALTLRESLLDRRALIKAGVNGLRRHLVNQDIRHELLRLVKHLILAAAIVLAILRMEGLGAVSQLANALRIRNIAIVTVSLLMSINSLMDLRGRHRIRELRTRRRGSITTVASSDAADEC
jgi:hypothetical protein